MDRLVVLVLVLALAACGSNKPVSPANRTGHAEPTRPSGPVTPAKLLSMDDLVARGATATKINEHETLVCAEQCWCITDLDCTGDTCITLDENLALFKKALARDTHPVMCNLADTGQLCDLRYFRFDGDIYRYEIRYFGPDGRLIGQSNMTDYPEYCDGKASARFAGRMPECAMTPWNVEVVCRAENSVPPGIFGSPLGHLWNND